MAAFQRRSCTDLEAKQRVVGVNLSGQKISGFDMSVDSVIRQVEAFFGKDS